MVLKFRAWRIKIIAKKGFQIDGGMVAKSEKLSVYIVNFLV